MMSEPPNLLVTGGAGFMSAVFVRRLLAAWDNRVFNLDERTFSKSLDGQTFKYNTVLRSCFEKKSRSVAKGLPCNARCSFGEHWRCGSSDEGVPCIFGFVNFYLQNDR
jgi:hypothetical protein